MARSTRPKPTVRRTADRPAKRRKPPRWGEPGALPARIVEQIGALVFQQVEDPSGQISYTYVSPVLPALFGFDVADFLDAPEKVYRAIYGDAFEEHMTLRREAAATMSAWTWSGPARHKNGETLWVEFVVRPERRGDGTLLWNGIVIDMSARWRAEEAFKASQQLLMDIARNMPGHVYRRVLHRDGRIRYTFIAGNETALFGDSGAKLIQDPREFEATIVPEDRERRLSAIRESAETGNVYDIEYRMNVPGRGQVWVHSVAHPRRLANGDVEWNGIVIDTTERKHVENELRRAKEGAELANRAKSEFLANMSHELRTPLNAIIGFSEMMAHELFGPLGDPRYVSYARDIQASAQHLLSVINDILDLAKVEAGRYELEENVIALAAVARACHNILGGHAAMRQLHFTVAIDSHLPAVYGDERAIKQVLLNLLSNAIKFTDPGGRVTVTGQMAEPGAIVLRITDTGIGIPPDQMAELFKPFRQLDVGVRRAGQGTGLGLSISRKLMELHGGTLEIESIPGRGTTASMSFPPERTIRAAS